MSFHDPEHATWLQSSVSVLSMLMDHQEIYSEVLQLCPNLRELHLHVYHTFFRPKALEALANSIPPTVRVLRVRAYHYTALFQLLSLFPHIEYLEVEYRGTDSSMPAPIPWAPPQWSLRQLWYSNRRQQARRFIEWALSGPGVGSRHTLEALRAQCPMFSPSILSTLEVSSLRLLSIPALSAHDNLSAFSRLEEVWLTAPRHASLTFLPLPAQVRRLVLYRLSETADYDDVLADLSAYYERSGRHLEAVTYHRDSTGDEGDILEDVRMLYNFCVARNLSFELMDPPYGSYPGEVRG
ncbi:hypothetical protein BN946_scf185007.g67 [Trametes cinnabarina]|uniref:F-box domain-containing protein n=1 Tax=Pycnoporus cinnabarinus TaxID=5643 RepID=A0A060SKQ5_PYCCI|nr:hypothetical protein BN946_scf185007.g67 [Trametes cinnabarina]